MCCRLLLQRIPWLSSSPFQSFEEMQNPVFIKFLIVSVLVHEAREMKEMVGRRCRSYASSEEKLDHFLSLGLAAQP